MDLCSLLLCMSKAWRFHSALYITCVYIVYYIHIQFYAVVGSLYVHVLLVTVSPNH